MCFFILIVSKNLTQAINLQALCTANTSFKTGVFENAPFLFSRTVGNLSAPQEFKPEEQDCFQSVLVVISPHWLTGDYVF